MSSIQDRPKLSTYQLRLEDLEVGMFISVVCTRDYYSYRRVELIY